MKEQAPSRRGVAARFALAITIASATMVVGIAPGVGHATPLSCSDVLDPNSGSYAGSTSSTFDCTVPAGVGAYTYVVRGANGGSIYTAPYGGAGAKITGTLVVTPGETLSITVGGNGGYANPGPGGGGGGGYSAIARGANPVIVGGGGGGDSFHNGSAIDGGDAGAGTPSTGGNGSSGQYGCGGTGAVDATPGTGGSSYPAANNNCPQATGSGSGIGGAGGAPGQNGQDASHGTGNYQRYGSGGGGGFGGTGGVPETGNGWPYPGPGGTPGGGGGAAGAGGGGGGYAGGGGGGGINSGGKGGGGGGSSLVPPGAVATASFTDFTDRAPRVEFPTSSAAPTIVSISPATGGASGGTSVTITGTGFQAGATVTLGGATCTVASVSATSITCTTGAHAVGVVDVVVTNLDTTTATLAGGYTYEASGALTGVDIGIAAPRQTVAGALVPIDVLVTQNGVPVNGGSVDISYDPSRVRSSVFVCRADLSSVGVGRCDGRLPLGDVTLTGRYTSAGGQTAEDQTKVLSVAVSIKGKAPKRGRVQLSGQTTKKKATVRIYRARTRHAPANLVAVTTAQKNKWSATVSVGSTYPAYFCAVTSQGMSYTLRVTKTSSVVLPVARTTRGDVVRCL